MKPPNEWKSQFYSKSWKEQYDLILETINDENLTDEFILELEFPMILLELLHELRSSNYNDEMYNLICEIKTKKCDFYKEYYDVFDDLLVDYYFLKGYDEKIIEGFKNFVEEPTIGIDQFINKFDKLIFYGYTEVAVNISLQVYAKLNNSQEIIKGVEDEFSNVFFTNNLQKTYKSIKNNAPIDSQKLNEELALCELGLSEDNFNELLEALAENSIAIHEFNIVLKKSASNATKTLSMEFFKYMLDEKELDFVVSSKIWAEFMRFLSIRKVKYKLANEYFTFSDKEFGSYLLQYFDLQWMDTCELGFATIWGIPYIYDFLYLNELITEQTYKTSIENINKVKIKFMENSEEKLWQYNFVHKWNKPESVTEEEFEEEKRRFGESVNIKKVPEAQEPLVDLNSTQETVKGEKLNYAWRDPEDLDDEDNTLIAADSARPKEKKKNKKIKRSAKAQKRKNRK
jgi:hypothetical protein